MALFIYLSLSRFHTHVNQTLPIVQHYEKLGLVQKIPALLAPDEVRLFLLMPFLTVPFTTVENYSTKTRKPPNPDQLATCHQET